jgi:hypothetical protein
MLEATWKVNYLHVNSIISYINCYSAQRHKSDWQHWTDSHASPQEWKWLSDYNEIKTVI